MITGLGFYITIFIALIVIAFNVWAFIDAISREENEFPKGMPRTVWLILIPVLLFMPIFSIVTPVLYFLKVKRWASDGSNNEDTHKSLTGSNSKQQSSLLPNNENTQNKKARFPKSGLVLIGIFLAVFIFWEYWYKTHIIRISGVGMSPEILNNECVVLRRSDSYSVGQIVLTEPIKSKRVVYRIIASPGDDLRMINGVIYVNNKKVKEGYVNHSDIEKELDSNEFFIIGDNKESSKYYLIGEEKILGLVDKVDKKWEKIIPGCAGSYINGP